MQVAQVGILAYLAAEFHIELPLLQLVDEVVGEALLDVDEQIYSKLALELLHGLRPLLSLHGECGAQLEHAVLALNALVHE